MFVIRYATFVLLLSLLAVGCGGASHHATQPSAVTSRSTSTSASSTGAFEPTGCRPATSGYVAEVFCYLNKAGIANQTIDSDRGPLLAHDLQDPGHACLNTIESYQTLLATAQSALRLQDIASVPANVRTPARWLSRAVTDDLAAARQATTAILSHAYLGFLAAWGVHAKAGRDLQAAAATFAAQ